MKTLNVIQTFSIDESISTGAIAKSDFRKHGKIGVSFFVSKDTIGVEVAGFCSDSKYFRFPKNKKQITAAENFVVKYINKCVNTEELKIKLSIK